jgi:hypothetical protein
MSGNRDRMSGRALVASVATTLLLAAAPFVVGHTIHDKRLAEARQDVAAIAELLPRLAIADGQVAVIAGPGKMPRFDDPAWVGRPSAPLGPRLAASSAPDRAPIELTPDPWGNAIVVNAGGRTTISALSAGPNGIVETPFDHAAADGDDIAYPLRAR